MAGYDCVQPDINFIHKPFPAALNYFHVGCWPVCRQLCWVCNEAITYAWAFVSPEIDWRLICCFPCFLRQASHLVPRQLVWLAMQIFTSPPKPPPFPFHWLQANVVMYLKNLVILMITISSYCTWYGFSPR